MRVEQFNLLIGFPRRHPEVKAIRKALRWVGLHHIDQPLLVMIDGDCHEIYTTQFKTPGERNLAKSRIRSELGGAFVDIILEDEVGYGNVSSKAARKE